MAPGISIIICCYNSCLRLPQTLRHLAQQQVPVDVKWEIVLVDNASTDATAELAEREWRKYNIVNSGFSILSEPTQGKNYAFKTGVLAAKFDYILTCDDDNWLSSDYVTLAFQIMQSDSEIGALGGQGIFEPELPANKEIENFTSYFVNGPQAWADAEHWVYGAGSIYKKSIFNELIASGWEQITTGRKGRSLICGEDVEICFMIYLSGYKIIADDRLKFNHYVPIKRQTTAYIARLGFWLSYSHVLLNSYYPILNNDERPIESIMNGWYRASTKTFIKCSILMLLERLKIWRATPPERRLSFNRAFGTWYSLYQNRKTIINHHRQTKSMLTSKTYALKNE